VSAGARAALPKAAARYRAVRCRARRCDNTIGGFIQCHHRQPAAGIDSHRDRVLGAVSAFTQQRLARQVDPAAGSQSGFPPPTRI
jgi:hypothetical protein